MLRYGVSDKLVHFLLAGHVSVAIVAVPKELVGDCAFYLVGNRIDVVGHVIYRYSSAYNVTDCCSHDVFAFIQADVFDMRGFVAYYGLARMLETPLAIRRQICRGRRNRRAQCEVQLVGSLLHIVGVRGNLCESCVVDVDRHTVHKIVFFNENQADGCGFCIHSVRAHLASDVNCLGLAYARHGIGVFCAVCDFFVVYKPFDRHFDIGIENGSVPTRRKFYVFKSADYVLLYLAVNNLQIILTIYRRSVESCFDYVDFYAIGAHELVDFCVIRKRLADVFSFVRVGENLLVFEKRKNGVFAVKHFVPFYRRIQSSFVVPHNRKRKFFACLHFVRAVRRFFQSYACNDGRRRNGF